MLCVCVCVCSSGRVGSVLAPGTGPILLDDVQCRGTETSIDQCEHPPWGTHNCNHREDVHIICAHNEAGGCWSHQGSSGLLSNTFWSGHKKLFFRPLCGSLDLDPIMPSQGRTQTSGHFATWYDKPQPVLRPLWSNITSTTTTTPTTTTLLACHFWNQSFWRLQVSKGLLGH